MSQNILLQRRERVTELINTAIFLLEQSEETAAMNAIDTGDESQQIEEPGRCWLELAARSLEAAAMGEDWKNPPLCDNCMQELFGTSTAPTGQREE